jgi:serine/threonine protein kinase
MTTPLHEDAEREARLNEVLLAYLEAVQEGRPPDRQELITRHPEFATELREFLALREEIGRLARPRRGTGLSAARSASRLSASGVAADTPAPAGVQTELGEIGEFHLIREIGRGGMGVVYEAHQASLNRRVALKVLPFAAALDPKQLRRFQNEAQAAACLHHTNIVPVYAVGCERGVHYYAMQLIEGQNLADLIRELRQLAGLEQPAANQSTGPYVPAPDAEAITAKPTPTLPTPLTTVRNLAAGLSTQRASRSEGFYRTAAGLAVQAADALEHAHQLGVIHRDIKPANLIVDALGTVWITDFGLAQFHTGAGLTRTGDLLGTLRYMSPEQAAGQGVALDARTDVYSLGATLYELLSLRPLFDGADHQRLLGQILYDEPQPLRQLDRSIPPELETIVLKAVSKNPAERYATAREFADDLRRFLDNRPILARRPTVVQRLRKWGRRHPSFVAAGVILLVLVTAGSWVSTALLRGEQAKTEKALRSEMLLAQEAKNRAQEAKERAQEAEKQFQLAKRSVDEMIQLAQEELVGSPFAEGLRKRLLETALAYYQVFIGQRRDDPNAQAELEHTRDQVKSIINDLILLQGDRQLSLLKNKDVLADLRLSEDQGQQIKDLMERMDAKRDQCFERFHNQTPEQRERQFIELAHENEDAVGKIIGPDGVKRLQQIALQCQGPMAFRDSSVATALKLTPGQKGRIRTIQEAAFPGPPDRGRGGRGGGPKGPPPWEEQAQRLKMVTNDIVGKVLTAEQQEQWRQMTGEPFAGPLPSLFGPGPRGGGSQKPPPKH